MGLDMYAFARKEGKDEIEIAYWRKHPNLHGWMEKLAESKDLEYKIFNGVELELTWDDLDELEDTVKEKELPSTQGFFFGREADKEYFDDDLKFIGEARLKMTDGYQVFYNSSW